MTLVGRRPAVLIIEDSPSMSALYAEYLQSEWTIFQAENGLDGLRMIVEHDPHVVLLDIRLPDIDGLEVLKRIRENDYPCSVVVMTAHGSVSVAVEAMRSGATDFILKPFAAERLIYTLKNAFDRRHLQDIVDTLGTNDTQHFCGFIGSSAVMQATYRIINAAARSKATVFITGESGTGKEVCAEAIHRRSPRAPGPFIALNCGAIPKDLIESEIFGHVKGAFTGAIADREGAASRAHGGTLFLDEICEMDSTLQTKMLRFIQTGIIQKVGGSKQEKVDVRFVCATNKDPEAEVAAGRFREDLYYRLHVLPIHLPPLREREHDIIQISLHYLLQYAKEESKTFQDLDRSVQNFFLTYPWPGNVRQLQNVIRNIVVLNEGTTVTLPMLPSLLLEEHDSNNTTSSSSHHAIGFKSPEITEAQHSNEVEIIPLWKTEKIAIERAIALCDGNIPLAAAKLGVNPSTLYRKKTAWENMA